MDEVKALDKIRFNFLDIKSEIDVIYIQDTYPMETDAVITMYQSNSINEAVAHELLLFLTNDIIPDRLRGL